MKTNYHTHTVRCGHAVGSDEAYVLSAIKGGFTELGFSEHSPWKYDSDYVSGMRMQVTELSEYVASVRGLQEKYQSQIKIRLGLECEYFKKYIPWLKDMVEKYQLDYLIFGNHFYKTDERYPYFGARHKNPDILKRYLESAIEGMESGLYAYLAHPDLYMRGYLDFDKHCELLAEEICDTALRLDIPLEYNLEGIYFKRRMKCNGYPEPEFWKIAAAKGCKIIIGADVHNPKHLEDIAQYDGAVQFIKNLGGNLIKAI